MKSLHFESVWKKTSDADRDLIKSMWRKYRALEGEDMMEKRSGEIVYVVRNEDGAIVGVSTARAIQAKFLNNHYFYEFRCFIAPPFRAPGLDSYLAVKTKSFLETVDNPKGKFKGMLMIIENTTIKNQRTKAVWPASEMVFVGYTSKGHHVRVGYFNGARI